MPRIELDGLVLNVGTVGDSVTITLVKGVFVVSQKLTPEQSQNLRHALQCAEDTALSNRAAVKAGRA